MKRLFLLIISVAFLGCSDDDNNDTGGAPLSIDPAIVGEWVATDIIGQTNLPDCLSSEKLKFRLSGKFYHTVVTGYTPCTSSTYEGTYTVNNDIITLDSPGGVPLQYKILSLSATKLQLRVHFSQPNLPVTEYTKQ
ncbi:lipocalin family protein [Flavobacterium sp. J372]|uniref:lipocalin family protein n=1 Tax=Flavobacterium sp. J372 TaxID=2898436 RepID=UPI0021515E8E|nr:lipocalin family protein [Flavobacterium sp. J372]MCR5862428.1 lipocalin family protein [Flavobacterium sp. J372]